VVLAAAVPIVRVFLNSGVNSTGLDAMPLELAEAAEAAVGNAWPLAAPFVGALGSFVSGSATFSHLMFASLQESVATSVGVDPTVVLAQQVGGANAGNMVCVANVVTVAAVVGVLGREGEVIKVTVIPMAVYSVLFAAIGMALA
jgi:lactate permease